MGGKTSYVLEQALLELVTNLMEGGLPYQAHPVPRWNGMTGPYSCLKYPFCFLTPTFNCTKWVMECQLILGPAPPGTGTIAFGSNFWKFYIMRTSFTLSELVSLVKVFRLFRLEQIFLVFRVWTQQVDVQHLIYWQGRQGQRVCDALLVEPSPMRTFYHGQCYHQSPHKVTFCHIMFSTTTEGLPGRVGCSWPIP